MSVKITAYDDGFVLCSAEQFFSYEVDMLVSAYIVYCHLPGACFDSDAKYLVAFAAVQWVGYFSRWKGVPHECSETKLLFTPR